MARTLEVGSAEPVIRVLRCQKTQRFFSRDGWSDDARRAEVFADEIDAVRACVANNLEDIELVIRMESSHVDLFCTALR